MGTKGLKRVKRTQKTKGKKSKSKQPTPKQMRAAKLMSEAIMEGSGKSQRTILKEAGYSHSIQKSPARVTKTDGFQKALDQFLPMDGVFKRHKELMHQNDHLPTAMRALDKAYDVHGVTSDKNGVQPYATFLQLVVQQTASKEVQDVIDVEAESTEG